jgi:hypothetical protein
MMNYIEKLALNVLTYAGTLFTTGWVHYTLLVLAILMLLINIYGLIIGIVTITITIQQQKKTNNVDDLIKKYKKV